MNFDNFIAICRAPVPLGLVPLIVIIPFGLLWAKLTQLQDDIRQRKSGDI
jgi:hypothetical protein